MNRLLPRLTFFAFSLVIFDTVSFSQLSIESKIDSFLSSEINSNGKQKIKKIKSNDTIEYFAFVRKTNALLYYYRTIRNQHGVFKLDPARFYFSSNQLVYVRAYFPNMPKNNNTAFYEFKDESVIQRLGTLGESERVILSYVETSRRVLEKSRELR